MFACGQLRHDAAVLGMDFDLGGNHRTRRAPIHNYGRAGFVARSFDGQKPHRD
jgi:hypothetical protein